MKDDPFAPDFRSLPEASEELERITPLLLVYRRGVIREPSGRGARAIMEAVGYHYLAASRFKPHAARERDVLELLVLHERRGRIVRGLAFHVLAMALGEYPWVVRRAKARRASELEARWTATREPWTVARLAHWLDVSPSTVDRWRASRGYQRRVSYIVRRLRHETLKPFAHELSDLQPRALHPRIVAGLLGNANERRAARRAILELVTAHHIARVSIRPSTVALVALAFATPTQLARAIEALSPSKVSRSKVLAAGMSRTIA